MRSGLPRRKIIATSVSIMPGRIVIPSTWELPVEIASRFGEKTGRQRLMEHGGHLLLVLHTVPRSDSTDREGALFWRKPGGDWESTEKGNGLNGLKKHVDSYAQVVEELDLRLDTTRDADGLFKILSAVAPLLRAAKNMRLVLQTAREATGADRDIITLRDQAEEIERTADLLRLEEKNALDFDIARRAEEQAARGEEISALGHRLNMLAALFLPVTAVSSVLGVNIPIGIEEWLTPTRYWILIALCIGLGLVLQRMLTKRS